MLALALGIFAAGLAPASAHAALVSSNPQDGSTVRRVPAIVTLDFSEPVSRAQVAVFNPDGTQIATPQVDQLDSVVSVPVRPSGQRGTYTLVYRVVSADGHVVSRSIRFTASTGRMVVQHSPKAASEVPEQEHGHSIWWILAIGVIASGLVVLPLRKRSG